MKFERTCVSDDMIFNALYGMRNPKNSWDKFDSRITNEGIEMGDNDKDLASRLINAGSEHCKFLRQIPVSVQITAPAYWWPEMDQYKVGTTTDSTSKMHKLTSKEITIDCFEDYIEWWLISKLESFRRNAVNQDFSEEVRREWWDKLLAHLPHSWLQTRMWSANYATLRNIYKQRKHHKLKQWHQFCEWIEILPESWMITQGIK